MSSNLGVWVLVQVEGQWPSLAFNQIAPKKQPRPLMAAQSLKPPPTYYNPHSQPSKYSGPAHTMLQPCIRSGTTTGEALVGFSRGLPMWTDMNLGHVWVEPQTATQAVHVSSVSTQAHWPRHSPPLQQTPQCGRRKTLKSKEPNWAQPSGFLLQQLGSSPCHDRAAGDCASEVEAVDPATPATTTIKVIAVSTPWRKTWLVSTSHPAFTLKTFDTHSLHRNAPTKKKKTNLI